jgi:ribosome biogenesis GTPase
LFSLESIGADADWRLKLERTAVPDAVLARVTAVYGDECDVITEAGPARAETSGALRFSASSPAELPVTGDWVAARLLEPGRALIHAVLTRRSIISRGAAGRRHDEQPLAANVDLVLVVCGLDRDFNPRRIERYLTLAVQSRVAPLIALSKSDLCGDTEARIHELRPVCGNAELTAVSALDGTGLDSLHRHIAGKTAAMLGSSGAGKSTLVNALLGREAQVTNTVRESDGRGRHTTTRRDLIPLEGGGALIDTPGLRELQLWADSDSVDDVFPEITALAALCRFNDCRHDQEPGCAVRPALQCGDLDPARWESWRKLRREAQRHEMLTDRAAAEAAKQRLRAIHKSIRAYYKDRR